MKTRVLHLITHLGIGGAQDNTLLTVRDLPRSHYEVHLAAGRHETDWRTRGEQWSDAFHSISHLRHSINPAHDIQALRELIMLLRRERYDIVHTHSSKAGVLGRIAAAITHVPIVVHTVHGFPWSDYMPFPVRSFYQNLERALSRVTDSLVTVSELNRDELIRLHIAPPQKIVTIYSGIDTARFSIHVDRNQKCAELGLDPGAPIVGMVARLSAQKAPLDFLAAARRVRETLPGVQFVLVGDGPLRPVVEAACKSMTNVALLGSRADVPEIVALFDVFALSSLWEGLGRALTEALMLERPVAVTAVDGVPELVTDEVTGLLSPPGCPDLLSENIVRLLLDRAFAQRLGFQGGKRVRKRFAATTMVHHIDELYQRLLMNNQEEIMLGSNTNVPSMDRRGGRLG